MLWIKPQSLFSETNWKGKKVFVNSKKKFFDEDNIDFEENITNIIVFIMSMINI